MVEPDCPFIAFLKLFRIAKDSGVLLLLIANTTRTLYPKMSKPFLYDYERPNSIVSEQYNYVQMFHPVIIYYLSENN